MSSGPKLSLLEGSQASDTCPDVAPSAKLHTPGKGPGPTPLPACVLIFGVKISESFISGKPPNSAPLGPTSRSNRLGGFSFLQPQGRALTTSHPAQHSCPRARSVCRPARSRRTHTHIRSWRLSARGHTAHRRRLTSTPRLPFSPPAPSGPANFPSFQTNPGCLQVRPEPPASALSMPCPQHAPLRPSGGSG
uniref:Uncharacterized protein n=1 Tax=Rousettus aegyptiacus TaxID=9407 RepID=A0A7J8BST9_ROUAE|nr:hypothetical protein HJG63_009630 [Rousettus aegyptiacus]